jgi:quinoprotein glucose dehydrogenase
VTLALRRIFIFGGRRSSRPLQRLLGERQEGSLYRPPFLTIRFDKKLLNRLVAALAIATALPWAASLTIATGIFGVASGLAFATEPQPPFIGGGPARTANPLPDGTAAAERQIAGLRLPPGMRIELFAAEPLLGNPVALCLDERNRVYVAEQYRFNQGTEENRTRPFLLEDDLQVRTLADRVAMYRKHLDKFAGGWEWFSRHTDQVRLLEDRDGDGRAERSTVYADGFNGVLDGLAAGLTARDGAVWLTCVPRLWRLRDRDGDGRADERQVLLEGFGVNAAFLGHDLHGLAWGPDGRLYFSVGDRGFHVATPEGPVLATPRRGAVFRCWPDGRGLEVVHTGLRNPQELAFDDHGNLFAADNNCDRGDHSRLVYVVDGGDSGWNMAFQTIPDPYPTGPWHAERMWYVDGDPAAEGLQPAWVLPPVGKLGAGPSGFAHYPGTGLAPRYRDHFFLCNYTGNGGLEAFAVKPRGASFEIVDAHDFLKPIFATDCDFGYDGQLYVSDYVGLEWNGGSRGGRVYRLFDPRFRDSPDARQTQELFAAGFATLSLERLGELLAHADQRVRQRAQFALAERGGQSLEILQRRIAKPDKLIPRLHALWGLGQILRSHPELRVRIEQAAWLSDSDDEFRAQAARLIGDLGDASHTERLIELLGDPAARVRFFSSEALGRLRAASATEPLWRLIRSNNDADRYLRHAAVVALSRLPDAAALRRTADPDAAVRRAAVLVLRRQLDPACARFLSDPDPAIVTEAARAVHDLPLGAPALETLAAYADRLSASPEGWPEALTRRVVNANFRLAEGRHWSALAKLASAKNLSSAARRDALDALRLSLEPPNRDRVTGEWNPPRRASATTIREAVKPTIAALLAHADDKLRPEIAKLAGRLELPVEERLFVAWTTDSAMAATSRIAALQLLDQRRHPELPRLLERLVEDPEPAVRSAVREQLARRDPARGARLFIDTLSKSTVTIERQEALAGLARLKTAAADDQLLHWAEKLAADEAPPELHLDIIEAVAARDLPAASTLTKRFQDRSAQTGPLGKFRSALMGGDAARGRELFRGHRVAQCQRCHKAHGEGGDAGPDLSQVANRHDRAGLLESLVDPSAKIAPNFGTVSVVLNDGRVVAGTLRKETATAITLLTPDGRESEIQLSDIDERTPPRSPMPAVDRALSLRELRDLVAFLAELR